MSKKRAVISNGDFYKKLQESIIEYFICKCTRFYELQHNGPIIYRTTGNSFFFGYDGSISKDFDFLDQQEVTISSLVRELEEIKVKEDFDLGYDFFKRYNLEGLQNLFSGNTYLDFQKLLVNYIYTYELQKIPQQLDLTQVIDITFAQQLQYCLANLNKVSEVFHFYIRWMSLYLRTYNYISLKELDVQYTVLSQTEKNNPYFLTEYARVLGIHFYSITKKQEYIKTAFLCIKKAKILFGEQYKRGYFLGWEACVYISLGEYNKALVLLNEAISINEKEFDKYKLLYFWKIKILLKIKKFDDALCFSNSLIETFENSPKDVLRLHRDRAYIFIEKSDIDRAYEELIKALYYHLRVTDLEVIENGKLSVLIKKTFEKELSSGLFEQISKCITEIANLYEKKVSYGEIHFVEFSNLEELCYKLKNIGKNK